MQSETEKDDHESINELIRQNQELLSQNHELIKKLYRNTIWSFYIKIIGFLIIVGAPVALYYYVLEPYFDSVGSSFQTFVIGLQEVPGWKQFQQALGGNEQ